MRASNQTSLVLVMTLPLMGIQPANASTCPIGRVDRCLSGEAVDLGVVNKRDVYDAGVALLQVGQDLGHHHTHKHTSMKSHPKGHHHAASAIQHAASTHHMEGMKSHPKGHHHAASAHQHKVPTELLTIMREPRDDAAINGALKKGVTFKVSSEYEAPDGRVWLHLSDGRGWVRRDEVSEIQQAPSTKVATPQAAAPKTQDQIREEYRKLPMKETGLAEQLEHNHGKTINADWRNEYPYKKDPPKKKPWHKAMFGTAAYHSFSCSIGLSIIAALAA